MAKYFPIAFCALYCRRWSGTLEGFASDQAVIGQVEWHGDEVTDLAHGVSSLGFFSQITIHRPRMS
jgi:hypothetical protein